MTRPACPWGKTPGSCMGDRCLIEDRCTEARTRLSLLHVLADWWHALTERTRHG